jgi:hypothetical protein
MTTPDASSHVVLTPPVVGQERLWQLTCYLFDDRFRDYVDIRDDVVASAIACRGNAECLRTTRVVAALQALSSHVEPSAGTAQRVDGQAERSAGPSPAIAAVASP